MEKPTRLAIGVEGGFDGGLEKCEIQETLSVVTMPELTSVPWPCEQMPLQVSASSEMPSASDVAGVFRCKSRYRVFWQYPQPASKKL